MALTIHSPTKVPTASELFGALGSPHTFEMYEVLVKKGVYFKVDYLSIEASDGGGLSSLCHLPRSTPSIVSGALSKMEMSLCATVLNGFLVKLIKKLGINLPPDFVNLTVTEVVEQESLDTIPVTKTLPATGEDAQGLVKLEPENPKSNEVISLSNATDILQKVHGSDPDSVYIVMAVGKYANLAARCKNDSVSLRVESKNPSNALMKKLPSLGFGQKSPTHWSLHTAVNDPVVRARMLGSAITAMVSAGFKFDKVELDVSKAKKGV